MSPPKICYTKNMSVDIFAVIHSRNQLEAFHNADLAIKCGCNGVFFISHGDLTSKQIIELSKSYESEYAKIGVNLLGERVENVVDDIACYVDMLWSDYTPTGIEKEIFSKKRDEHLCYFDFYGGIAFKYQPQPDDLFKAAQEARGLVDILTTSGVGTGSAPDIAKLAVLAEGFEKKIAVASGVTPDNAAEMLPYVNHFLVATGISKNFYTIDEDKCKALVDVIRSTE